MEPRSVARVLRLAEFVYATLALFALTQGPVYEVWRHSAEREGTLPNPSMPFVYFTTFLALQAPAVALFMRRVGVAWLAERRNIALVVLLAWIGMSVLWSTFARQSLPEFVALAATALFGTYLATSFTVRQFWWIVTSAMSLGVGLSWFAVMRLWEGAYNFRESYWVGIYLNRNSLAPVATVAILAVFGVLVSESRGLRKTPLRSLPLIAAPLLTLAVFAGIEVWKSESQTSPAALVAAAATVVVWLVLRWIFLHVKLLGRLAPFAAAVTLVLLGVALFAVIMALPSTTTVSADVATLNSRRVFWSQSWLGILEKPWLGWGWMAAWRNPEFFRLGFPPPDWVNSWSHNGYHDMVLGGGIVAGLIFCAYLLLGWSAMGRSATHISSLDMLLAGFVVVSATQESFFIGSHFLWALLVAALSRPSLVDEQNSR